MQSRYSLRISAGNVIFDAVSLVTEFLGDWDWDWDAMSSLTSIDLAGAERGVPAPCTSSGIHQVRQCRVGLATLLMHLMSQYLHLLNTVSLALTRSSRA